MERTIGVDEAAMRSLLKSMSRTVPRRPIHCSARYIAVQGMKAVERSARGRTQGAVERALEGADERGGRESFGRSGRERVWNADRRRFTPALGIHPDVTSG